MEYLIILLSVAFVYKKLSDNPNTEILMSSRKRYQVQNELIGENK